VYTLGPPSKWATFTPIWRPLSTGAYFSDSLVAQHPPAHLSVEALELMVHARVFRPQFDPSVDRCVVGGRGRCWAIPRELTGFLIGPLARVRRLRAEDVPPEIFMPHRDFRRQSDPFRVATTQNIVVISS
jgi:hypothetical protein